MNTVQTFISATLGALTLQGLALAQANYIEEFEAIGSVTSGQQGPQGLIDRGWIFRNQSFPAGGSSAFNSGGGVGWPYNGAGFLMSTSNSAGQFGAAVSNWAILPVIPNQQAGDVLSLWALDGGYGATSTYFDVRYSPTGGTSTGSGPSAVGDFTHVLFTAEMPIDGQTIYTRIQQTLPGSGRLAFRFHAPAVSNFMSIASLNLDSLTIGEAPSPPCGLHLPGPGETVIWPASPAPYVVCQDLVIPETATLILGAGARMEVVPGRNLTVEGTLMAQGTGDAPVVISGDNVSGLRVHGRAELHHADLTADVYLFRDSTLEAFDSVFRETAWISSAQPRAFARLERCEVRSEAATFARTTILKDVAITNPQTYFSLNGFWRTEGVASVAPLVFISNMQDRVVDNVSVTGVTVGPALDLQAGGAGEFHLGSGNSLTGNLYPAWPRFGGLTPDSTVPPTGNINNAIMGVVNAWSPLRSRISIPDLGVPYHFLERGGVRGEVNIEPGTVLKFGPLGGLTVGGDNGSDGTLRGLPGKPIVLERLDPGTPWFSLATGPGWQIFEHLHISGAAVGVVGNEAELWLRDTVIRDCEQGAHPAADGNIYGSGVEFYNNALGLRDDVSNPAAQVKSGVHFSGAERPNIFEGNIVAARNFGTTNGTMHLFRADRNWWGDPSGPFEPNFHPSGTGDEVTFGVSYQPWLTQRPVLSNARPVVRLTTRLHPAVHPGEKIIVEWDASDDGAIASFDVVMLDPNYNLPPGFHFITLGGNLPGSQRSFEITVPDVGLHPYERFPFRIIATDNEGESGFDQFWLSIPHQTPSAEVSFHTALNEFRGGEDVRFCYSALGLNTSPVVHLEAAADDRVAIAGNGNSGTNVCTFGDIRMPFVSSDRIRIGLRAQGNWNRDEWYFTDYFTIRPDPRLGDAPPVIQVISPTAGQSFAGGQTVPIRWVASDDHPMREFRIQASFNGGYTYHTIVTSLPGSASSYDWKLPTSSGIPGVRLRVVAVDSLMQNSSAGDDRTIEIRPGVASQPCYANCDASTGLPVLTANDFLCFMNKFAAGDPYANCDGSSGVPALTANDFQCFLNRFALGCP